MFARWIGVPAAAARFWIVAAVVAIDCSALGAKANGAEVDVAIVFAIDASASVDRATADMQRDGHADALCAPDVIAAIARNRTGCIAVAYFEWASQGNKRLVLPWTTVCGIGDAQAAAASIRTNGSKSPCSGRCGTSLSFAVDFGSLFLDEFAADVPRRIIDVSANGTNNDGTPVEWSRRRAVEKGYTINAIAIPRFVYGIGHDLTDYFARNVIGGPNAFVMAPSTKEDYAVALRRKLVLEIGMSAGRSW